MDRNHAPEDLETLEREAQGFAFLGACIMVLGVIGALAFAASLWSDWGIGLLATGICWSLALLILIATLRGLAVRSVSSRTSSKG